MLRSLPSVSEAQSGLEGVIAFATEIAEPDVGGRRAALSRRRHRGARGAPSRVLALLDDVEREWDAERYVKRLLDRGDRLMGFGRSTSARRRGG
jgi:hypothetical protein